MFDIGFWEMAFIGVIALLVIGPERLPKVARTAGLWLGKARAMVGSVKAEIDRELAAEELKKNLEKQAQSSGLHEIIEETQSIASDAQQSLNQAQQAFNQSQAGDSPDSSESSEPDQKTLENKDGSGG